MFCTVINDSMRATPRYTSNRWISSKLLKEETVLIFDTTTKMSVTLYGEFKRSAIQEGKQIGNQKKRITKLRDLPNITFSEFSVSRLLDDGPGASQSVLSLSCCTDGL